MKRRAAWDVLLIPPPKEEGGCEWNEQPGEVAPRGSPPGSDLRSSPPSPLRGEGLKRRAFFTLIGGAAAWPLTVRGESAERIRRIALLVSRTDDDVDFQERFAAFRQVLEKAGWSEGRNVKFEERSSSADAARMRAAAAELLALAPDLIVTTSNLSTVTMARLTSTIPIVFATAGDPVGTGLVPNMARPGGNVTGFAAYEISIAGKWLELLRELVPGVRRVALIYTPGGAGSMGLMRTAVELAHSFGIQTAAIAVDDDASGIDEGMDAFAAEPGGGVIVLTGPNVGIHRERIIAAVSRHRLPAIYPFRYHVATGGLMSYTADIDARYRGAAGYVDRILRGENPGDLPVQAPVKYELVINLKTAKALGLTIPEAFLLRADEVIE